MYGEGAVTDQMCQKWTGKFHPGDFSLDDAPWSGRPVEVDSDQVETLTEQSTIYHTQGSQHTQNIQINNFTGEIENRAFYFTEKTTDFLDNLILLHHARPSACAPRVNHPHNPQHPFLQLPELLECFNKKQLEVHKYYNFQPYLQIYVLLKA